MAKGSGSGDDDEGGGDEVAKAAMRVATPTNFNPNQSVERREERSGGPEGRPGAECRRCAPF